MGTVLHRHTTIASALIIALVAFCANCVQAIDSPTEHMASSTTMPDDCPMTREEHRRCAGESLKVQQGPVAKPIVLSAPTLDLAASFIQAEPRQLDSQWNAAANSASPKRPDVPTYLLDSTFRI